MQYRVDGADVAAGTYPGTGTVVVTAVAQPGYELTAGPTSWSLPFTDITLVTAEDPTQVDTYGTADDTYTVPATPGVQYRVDGADVAAGTYPGSGTVVVTAVAQPGHELTGPTSWSLPFTDIRLASAEEPSKVDDYGTADDTYTVPTTEGVTYQVDGADVAAGTYPGTGTVVVTAVAQPGYELTGPATFTLEFTDIRLVQAEAPTQVDGYGTSSDTYTVVETEGVTYQVDGVDVTAGTYPGTGTVVVTAVAQTGYALSGATSFSLPFTDIHQVAADAPGQVDTFRTASDTYTVPSVPGVRYLVDGVTTAAGTYPGTGTVVVTAVAEDGYELTGPDSFTLVFTDLQPATPVAPAQQDKGGTANDTYTLPAVPGITYLVGGVPVAPGTYPGTGSVVVTVVPEPGFALDGPDTFTIVFDAAVEQVAVAVPDLGVAPSQGSTPGTYTIPDGRGRPVLRRRPRGPARHLLRDRSGGGDGRGRRGLRAVRPRDAHLRPRSGPVRGRRHAGAAGCVRPAGRDERTATRDGEVRDETVAATVREGSLARTGAGPGPVLAASTLLMAAGVALLAGSRRRAARG